MVDVGGDMVALLAFQFALLVKAEQSAVTQVDNLDPSTNDGLQFLKGEVRSVLRCDLGGLPVAFDDLCHSSYFLKILRLSGFRLVGGMVNHLQDQNRLERRKTN